jgi:hypothetical protein
MKNKLPVMPRWHVVLGATSAALGCGLAVYVVGFMVFLLAGCGSGGGLGGGVAGPAGGSSFAGSTVTINPTLAFGAGSTVTYTNTEAGSVFPAAVVSIVGTYAYTPGADATTGTLDLTLPAPVGVLSFSLKNFRVQGGNVTSFETVYEGRTFQATVTVGTLAARGSQSSPGGSVVIDSPASPGGIVTTPPIFPGQPSGHENSTITP